VELPMDRTYGLIWRNVFWEKRPEYAHKVIEGSSSVSRKHCRICWRNGQFFIEDMGSLNHTYVNGILVKNGECIPLQTGGYDTDCRFGI